MRSIIKKEFTLSNEEQEILARACRIKKFKYAETIYNEVDDRTHYYYLINGNIEITKLYGDREVPFYKGRGRFFPNFSQNEELCCERVTVASKIATVLVIKHDVMEKLVRAGKEFCNLVWDDIIEELDFLKSLSQEIGNRNKLEALDRTCRLYAIFIDEKDKNGHYELPRSLNQEKLSKILGTTRVTVNKKIKELRQKRVLLQKERNMRIANEAIEEFKNFL